MTIDAKELREAIGTAKNFTYGPPDTTRIVPVSVLVTLLKAASAYAASLPREVEVEGWVLVDRGTGKRGAFIYQTPEAALDGEVSNRIPVRLTGTALLPPREKD